MAVSDDRSLTQEGMSFGSHLRASVQVRVNERELSGNRSGDWQA